MTEDEFEAGLDSWGGDLESWPAAQQPAAMALLEASPTARAALAAMLAVEAALTRTSRPELPGLDGLVARVTAQRQERRRAPAWRLRYAAAAVALLAAGYAYGALTPAAAEDWFGPAFTPAEAFDVN